MAGKLRFEAWTLPTAATFERRAISIPVRTAEGRREVSRFHNCKADIPESWGGLAKLATAPLIRVYDGPTFVDEYVVKRQPRNLHLGDVVNFSGPQLGEWGLTRALVYPPDYGTNPSKRPNWKWGMENLIDLDVGGLGNTNERWTFYLSGERYELDVSLASSGTYTLNVGGNDTDPIDWDAEASTIKSELEALAGVTEVTVDQPDPDTREFFVIFENPKDLGSDMTLDDSGISNLGVLTKLSDGFDTGSDPTFTITVDGQTTTNLPWDATANQVEGSATGNTGLQGLSNVNDVRVSGSGTYSDPWDITFINPPDIDSFTVTFSGTAVYERVVAGGYSAEPVTISKPIDEGTGPEEVHGSYGNPPLEVVTDVVDTDADYSVLVRARSRFAGSQLVLNAKEGEIYQASIRLRPAANSTYVLVIHDENQNQIARTADTPLTAGSFQELSLSDILIPTGVQRVIMRVAVVSTTTGNQYVNWQGARFVTGLEEDNPGVITRTILEHSQAQGDAIFVEPSWTDTEDSAGNAWPQTHSYQADGFAMNILHVLEDWRDLNYEFTLTPKATPSGSYTHDLNLYIPDGAGTDRTTTGPTLTLGGGVIDGTIVDRIPDFTVGVAWGADDLYYEGEDASTKATYGRLTRMVDEEEHADAASLEDAVDAALDDEAKNRKAADVIVRGSGSVIPFVHFQEGDLLVFQAADRMAKNERRAQTVSWRHRAGQVAEYAIQGSRVWGDPIAAIAEGLRRLMDAPKKRRRGDKVATVDRSAANGGSVGAHIHLERSTSQSIDSGSPVAVDWDGLGTFAPRNFATPTLPGSEVTIQEPGYYDIHVGLLLAAVVDSPSVSITLTRSGSEQTVWPMASDPSIWTADYDTDRFSGTAKAIPCQSGDVIQVYVEHSVGSAVNLSKAVLAAELVDRVSDPSTGAQATSALYVETSQMTEHPVTLPQSSAGDLIIVGLATAGNVSLSFPGGWTDLGSENISTSNKLAAKWAYKVADGGEGGSVDVTLGSSMWAFGHSVVVSGDTSWSAPDIATTSENLSDGAFSPAPGQPPTVSPSSPGSHLVFVSYFTRNLTQLSGPDGWQELENHTINAGGVPDLATLLSQTELSIATSLTPGVVNHDDYDNNIRGRILATIAVKLEE